MPDSNTMGVNSSGYYLNHTTDGSGDNFKVLLKTENKFLDKDIAITVNTPSAGTVSFEAQDANSGIAMGNATNGVYSPTATITGNISFTNDGWVSAGPHNISDTNVVVGTVNQSTMTKDGSAIVSGSTIIPTDSSQIINISEGYNSARTLTVGAADAGAGGEVQSGSATINSVTYTYNSTNDNFTVQGSADVSAPTVTTPGYISNTKGTLSSNVGGASVSATSNKISLGVDVTGAGATLKPTIKSVAVPDSVGSQSYGYKEARQGSTLLTELPELPQYQSRAYVGIRTNEITGTLTVTPKVTAAGYGDTTNYGATGSTTTTTAAQSDVFYVRIKEGSITSSDVTISSLTPTYSSDNDNFSLATTTTIPAPTYNEGFVAYGVGAKHTGTATVDATLPKIGITGSLSYSSGSTGLKTPSISKDSNTNIAGAGTATTTKPSSGYYVAVKSAKSSVNVTAVPTVTTTGYGDTTSGHYTANNSAAAEVGAATSSVTYIPLTAATFANSATSGTTYTDISSTAPVLISGDYLYINAGYTPAQKISLAKLVPDATQTNASAAYILSGYSAFNNDGGLIVGTMATYDGTYEVV